MRILSRLGELMAVSNYGRSDLLSESIRLASLLNYAQFRKVFNRRRPGAILEKRKVDLSS
jgi:hypothetical protein